MLNLYAYKTQAIYLISFLILTLLLISFAIYTMKLLFNKISNPEGQQNSFNIFFDRILPVAIIIMVPLLILFTKQNVVTNLTLLIILHLIVTIPLMHFWAHVRKWNINTNEVIKIVAWNHPSIYKKMTIGLLYPLIWVLYFNILRYLRLGKVTHINDIFISSIFLNDYFWITLFLSLFYSIWIRLIWWRILDIRNHLWLEVYTLILSLHLALLKYDLYFKLMDKIYKIAFAWRSFLERDLYVHAPGNTFQFITLFYKYPFILTVFIILIVLFELIASQGILYYSYFVLFIYPILYIISSFLINFYNKSQWKSLVCVSDYLNRRFLNPRYPYYFWAIFDDNELRFNFNWEFNDLESMAIELLKKTHYDTPWSKRIFTLCERIEQNPKRYNYCKRLRISYHAQNSGIRWVHTTKLTTSVGVFHKATAYFARSPWDFAALINNSWSHYSVILKTESLLTTRFIYPTNNLIYSTFNKTYNLPDRFCDFVENNTLTNFSTLYDLNVTISPFLNQTLDSRTQAKPDVVLDFSKSEHFEDKRVHGMDLKVVKNPGIAKSTILSDISVIKYQLILDNLSTTMQSSSTNSVKQALNALKKTSYDLKEHQIVWANNLHLFPSTFIPPLRVPNNFSAQDLHPEFLQKLALANVRMQKVSDYLFFKNIPPTIQDSLPESALDLFNDSFIQQIFKDNPL